MIKNLIKHPRRGFTLTEITIVLGISGLVLSSIWLAAGSVIQKNQINRATVELQTITQNILSLMQGKTFPTFPGFDATADMVGGNIIPNYAVIGATAITPWGKPLKIWAMSATGFRVSFYNPETQICIALLMQGTGACTPTDAGCPIDIVTNSGATTTPPDPVTGWAIMSATEAATVCGTNPPGGGSLEFDYATF